MIWPGRFGFRGFWERKEERRPSRIPFQFKSKSEVKAMGFRERKLYFEGLLTELYALQDQFGELERENLAQVAHRKYTSAARARLPGRTNAKS